MGAAREDADEGPDERWGYALASGRERALDDLFDSDTPVGLHRVRWIGAAFTVLLALSVRWYLRDPAARIWLALPHWVLLSLAAVLAITRFVLVVSRYWPNGDMSPPASPAKPCRTWRGS